MFVLSMKTTRPRLVTCGVIIGLLLVVMLAAGRRDRARVQSVAAGGDDAARVGYLQSLGYEVNPQWLDAREVTVPEKMNSALTAYNKLQKEVGNDLTPYLGKRVKCFTYAVTNHPKGDGVVAHLFEYDGRIIGGDISGKDFAQGLKPMK